MVTLSFFSEKNDKTVRPVPQLFIVHNSAGRKRAHALFQKIRARSSRCCGLALMWAYDSSHLCFEYRALRSNRVVVDVQT